MYHGRILSQTIQQSNAGASRKMVEIAGTNIPILMRRRHKSSFHEFLQTSSLKWSLLKEEKPMLQEDVQDDDFDGIRICIYRLFFLYTANSIYICILICKYVINVMDPWMICYWGTIFVMTTNCVNDLQTGSQGRSPKMSILTGLPQDVSGLYLNICLKMDDQLQNFVDGLFFFFNLYFFWWPNRKIHLNHTLLIEGAILGLS